MISTTKEVVRVLGENITPVEGMKTDPTFIPVRPDNSSTAAQAEEQIRSKSNLSLAMILSSGIALALIVYEIWRRK